jgi:hypothetical protein
MSESHHCLLIQWLEFYLCEIYHVTLPFLFSFILFYTSIAHGCVNQIAVRAYGILCKALPSVAIKRMK